MQPCLLASSTHPLHSRSFRSISFTCSSQCDAQPFSIALHVSLCTPPLRVTPQKRRKVNRLTQYLFTGNRGSFCHVLSKIHSQPLRKRGNYTTAPIAIMQIHYHAIQSAQIWHHKSSLATTPALIAKTAHLFLPLLKLE